MMKTLLDPRHMARIVALQKLFEVDFDTTQIDNINALQFSEEDLKKVNNTKKFDKKLFDKIIKLAEEWWYYGVILEDKGKVIEYEVVPIFQRTRNLTKEKAPRPESCSGPTPRMRGFFIRFKFKQLASSPSRTRICTNLTP